MGYIGNITHLLTIDPNFRPATSFCMTPFFQQRPLWVQHIQFGGLFPPMAHSLNFNVMASTSWYAYTVTLELTNRSTTLLQIGEIDRDGNFLLLQRVLRGGGDPVMLQLCDTQDPFIHGRQFCTVCDQWTQLQGQHRSQSACSSSTFGISLQEPLLPRKKPSLAFH